MNQILAVMLAIVAITLPQVLVDLPYGPAQAKTTDVLGILAIPIAFLACRYRGYSKKVGLATIAALGFAFVVIMFRIMLDDSRHLYREESLQLGRLFSIHAPLLLLAALPLEKRWLSRSMIGFGSLAVLSSLVIGVLYHFGSSAFDAHQTFDRGQGMLVNRLGGLPGETGAYAFNAMMGIQLLLVGLAMAGQKRLFWGGLLCFLPLYLAFVYHESLVRISVLNTIVFFAVAVIGVNHKLASYRFFLLSFVILACVVVVFLSAAGFSMINVEVERASLDGNLNQISSGRFAHWVAGLEETFRDPTYALFGMGYRAPEFVLGHPVENFFIFHLSTYGLIGTGLFFSLYAVLAWPVVKQALRGDFASGVCCAMLLAALVQWQVNDINLYYQTFPAVLLFTAWFSAIHGSTSEQPQDVPTSVALAS